jgi:hypothetical protein
VNPSRCALLGLVILALLQVSPGHAQPATPSQPETDRELVIKRLADELAPRLARTRYMEANPQSVTVPGWEGFPTLKHTYSVKDRATGGPKTASVIMLNPDARQLARWIVTACVEAKGAAAEAHTRKLSDWIISQSGAQFPVRGIVYEDILPANGMNEIYCFMNGVAVKVSGVEHRGEKQPTPEQMAKALNARPSDVTWVGKYARIQSTTREQYLKAGGKEKTEGAAWLEVSRKLYQAAWGKDRNELMVAWAKAEL